MIDSDEILQFWFHELTPADWFNVSERIDNLIRERYSGVLEAAATGELFSWRTSASGRLAEIIVLDQFSRNIHRGTPLAFLQDSLALTLAEEMIILKLDQELSIQQKAFAYMPYMHSESPLVHQEAMRLFSIPGLEENYEFEVLHKEIIDRFGRYPHRNKILGRVSTPEELEFLKKHPGF